MAKKKITDTVEELLAGFLKDEDYELYNCEYIKEGRDWFLRVYIDKTAPDEYVGTNRTTISRFPHPAWTDR